MYVPSKLIMKNKKAIKKAMKGLRIDAAMFKANLPAMEINDLVAGHELEIDGISIEEGIDISKPYLHFNVNGRTLKVSLRRFCTWLDEDIINDILNTNDCGALLLPTEWKVVATKDTYDDFPLAAYNLFEEFISDRCINIRDVMDGGLRSDIEVKSRQKLSVKPL